jgi:serine/threonine protein phosphatase 1
MIKTLPVNVSGRDFVVGDLHGCKYLFDQFLDHVKFMPKEDRVISVGDLIDRGPQSLECLHLLNEPWFHCVKANHEQLMEDYLTGGPTGPWWFRNGGNWWNSLELLDKDEVNHLLHTVQALPWLITVPMQDGKKFHVIHAELHALRGCQIFDSDLEDVERFKRHAITMVNDGESCIWGRELWGSLYAAFLDDRQVGKLRRALAMNPTYFNEDLSHIYSGHTTMRQPTTIGGQTNLDTGAFRVAHETAWAGLSFTEPLSGKFWTVKKDGVHSVQPIVI